MKFALPFLDIQRRPGKPRSNALTIVRDRIRPLEHQLQFLETYAPFVDYAKLSNISACHYSEELIDRKLSLYRKFDVTPMFGGIVFENAYVQGKVDAFIDYFATKRAAVEISNNIADVSLEDRANVIKRLGNVGVEVLCEVGEKYPTKPFDVGKMASEIEYLCDCGVKLVILERGEIDVVLGRDGQARTANLLSMLFDRVGHDRLIAEVETKSHILYMLKEFGYDVNLGPNIDWELVPWLEPARHGIGREIGHKTIEDAAERSAVRSVLA